MRHALLGGLMGVVLLGGWGHALAQSVRPAIAVTDLAYAEDVAEYFNVGQYHSKSQSRSNAKQHSSASQSLGGGGMSASSSYQHQASAQASGIYAEGVYSYIDQKELSGYTNDLKGALLKGTTFRLVQGKGFAGNAPQASRAEHVLQQMKGGKVGPVARQNPVKDVVARIRKGEFRGADYVLFGIVSSIDFTEGIHPVQGTNSVTRQYGLQLLADFSLINTKTLEISAAFSAQGEGNDTKIISGNGELAPPNRSKVMRETSRSLAADAYAQLVAQLEAGEGRLSGAIRPSRMLDEHTDTDRTEIPRSDNANVIILK